jgi:U3 small nucleolar RNA-associated protein 10
MLTVLCPPCTEQTLSRFASWVGSVLSGMACDTVQTHHDRLFKFFLDFFDYRRLSHLHEKAKKDVKLEKEVALVEDSFIDAFLHMVMKLSEVTFKPLFLRVTHWTTDVVDAKAGEAQSSTFPRLFFFWRLANALADKLKARAPLRLLTLIIPPSPHADVMLCHHCAVDLRAVLRLPAG